MASDLSECYRCGWEEHGLKEMGTTADICHVPICSTCEKDMDRCPQCDIPAIDEDDLEEVVIDKGDWLTPPDVEQWCLQCAKKAGHV